MTQLSLDTSVTAAPQGGNPLPDGDYVAVLVDDKRKDTKAGDGAYLELTLEVIDGPAKGRKAWDRLNLWSQNQQAKEIAYGALQALANAVGVPWPVQETGSLYNKPFKLRVGTRTNKKTGQKDQKLTYHPVNAQLPAPTAADRPAAGGGTGAAAPAKKPWET